jgi:hypothetical protein
VDIVRNPVGRPTKRDETATAKACEGLSYGLSNEEVAALVGVDISTFYDWLKIEEFQQRIAGAMAARKLIRLKRIENGDVGWQACCWLMERTDPLKWARPEISLMIQNNQGAVAGPSEAAFLKNLAAYHQLSNGRKSKVPEEIRISDPVPS